MSQYNMSQHNNSNSSNLLLRVIENYKMEAAKPFKPVSEFLHFHEKNPAARLQINLLEELRSYINKNLNHEDGNTAVLGCLLVLRALFSDPNPEGKVYSYLIERLKLDDRIADAIKLINPKEKIDPINPKYINLCQEAIQVCKILLEKPEISNKFSSYFIKDIMGTIATELEYDERVLQSIRSTSHKPR